MSSTKGFTVASTTVSSKSSTYLGISVDCSGSGSGGGGGGVGGDGGMGSSRVDAWPGGGAVPTELSAMSSSREVAASSLA